MNNYHNKDVSDNNIKEILNNLDVNILELVLSNNKITTIDIQYEMNKLCKSSNLILIDKCGHLSTIDQPQKVSEALLRWLV